MQSLYLVWSYENNQKKCLHHYVRDCRLADVYEKFVLDWFGGNVNRWANVEDGMTQ